MYILYIWKDNLYSTVRTTPKGLDRLKCTAAVYVRHAVIFIKIIKINKEI